MSRDCQRVVTHLTMASLQASSLDATNYALQGPCHGLVWASTT